MSYEPWSYNVCERNYALCTFSRFTCDDNLIKCERLLMNLLYFSLFICIFEEFETRIDLK